MKKAALLLLAAVLFVGISDQAKAADGNVSDGVLADMGLSSLQTMTDVQGDQVRGKGYASAWGYGSAHVYGASSHNGYSASGNYIAIGGNFSHAQAGWFSATSYGFSGAFAY